MCCIKYKLSHKGKTVKLQARGTYVNVWYKIISTDLIYELWRLKRRNEDGSLTSLSLSRPLTLVSSLYTFSVRTSSLLSSLRRTHLHAVSNVASKFLNVLWFLSRIQLSSRSFSTFGSKYTKPHSLFPLHRSSVGNSSRCLTEPAAPERPPSSFK